MIHAEQSEAKRNEFSTLEHSSSLFTSHASQMEWTLVQGLYFFASVFVWRRTDSLALFIAGTIEQTKPRYPITGFVVR